MIQELIETKMNRSKSMEIETIALTPDLVEVYIGFFDHRVSPMVRLIIRATATPLT